MSWKTVASGGGGGGRSSARSWRGGAHIRRRRITSCSVSSEKGKGPNLVRALLPKYVEAEAERIGCGPIRLKLPEVLE
ncbi:hypothetical protein GTY67_20085 [Streptomyces sp. SID8374]|uniref:hypothetical protein n=1 Tax=Streptomyces sp. SID8374 TaxID=2690354 RepID=UPI0013C9DB6A|nr:hypothetical protein [Streptomyces sp. SID8374]MYX15659.1 hypothetical protein [Streptomyces sp. SID8374]